MPKYLYEERDPLTGVWHSIGFHTQNGAMLRGRVVERACGCCGAPYGFPCLPSAPGTEPCPNLRLREENPQYVPQEQSA